MNTRSTRSRRFPYGLVIGVIAALSIALPGSAQESITTRFVPSVHGFHFINDFVNHIVGPIHTRGRCGGMAEVSLDYFYNNVPIPDIRIVDLGQSAQSAIAVTTSSSGVGGVLIDMFMRRDDNQIVHKRTNGRAWTDWKPTNRFTQTLSPAASTMATGRLDVSALGADRRIYDIWSSDGGANWDSTVLDGEFKSSPAIATPETNQLDVYALGLDNALYFNQYLERWRGPVSLGHPAGITLNSDPSAASLPGYKTVLVRGSDRAIWQIEWSRGSWLPWRSTGGEFTSGPAVASSLAGHAEAYGRGLDGKIWCNLYGGGRWSGWDSIGAPPPGIAETSPTAVSCPGYRDVFVRCNDKTVWHKSWSGGHWNEWASTETPISHASHQLTDAILERLMASTIRPLSAAIPTGGLTLLGIGTAAKFASWQILLDDDLWNLSSGDEMNRLARSLRAGRPLPLGLIAPGVAGHEVVAYGMDINVDAPGSRRRGPFTFIHIYDNNYPDRDDITIKLDPSDASVRPTPRHTITSSTGHQWRAVFVRDDYSVRPVPDLR